jgi:hypothetical protein
LTAVAGTGEQPSVVKVCQQVKHESSSIKTMESDSNDKMPMDVI